MLQVVDRHSLFPLEQQQPAIQVVGQHHQLKMHAVGRPAPGRMRRQAGIVIAFLDQILRPSPLVVEPDQQINVPIQSRTPVWRGSRRRLLKNQFGDRYWRVTTLEPRNEESSRTKEPK